VKSQGQRTVNALVETKIYDNDQLPDMNSLGETEPAIQEYTS